MRKNKNILKNAQYRQICILQVCSLGYDINHSINSVWEYATQHTKYLFILE